MGSAIGKPYPIWTLALIECCGFRPYLDEVEVETFAFWDRKDLEIFLANRLFELFMMSYDLSSQYDQLWEDFTELHGESMITITKSKIGSGKKIEETCTHYVEYGEDLLKAMFEDMTKKQDQEIINQLEEQEAA